MVSIAIVGIGAGLVSALLFSVVVTGSPLGMLLSYVASLPVLIAALGWNHRAGLVASAVGALVIALVFQVYAGIAYAVGSGLPAWWLAYLALLGRPGPDGTMEWYPLGRLLLWIGVIAAFITLTGIVALGGADEGAFRASMRRAMEIVVRMQDDRSGPDAAKDALIGPAVIEALITAIPILAAAMFAIVMTLNLWIAARVVFISGRLKRSWPDIAATAMPLHALVATGAAIVMAFLPGMLGLAGLTLAGGLAMAFALQGLALLHCASRGRPGRGVMLGLLYALVLVVGHTLLPLLALAGMADTALSLRRHLVLRTPKPPRS